MSFNNVDQKQLLPKLEEEILEFWDKENIFAKSLEIRSDAPQFSFFDGPPFASGTPHYGHIVASTMKDVVPRYWTMRGFRVERRWGWDCHGLPIETIAEKELGITHKKQIEELGVAKFNEVCRSKVLEYVSTWEKVIRRLGRWADMENAYRTMDMPYMESIWWVFKELWDRGLIYESYKSMHICPRCETTLSQSEVAEGYKIIKDLSVTAEFRLTDDPKTSILAWTTTPWTLMGNVALAVNPKIKYVKIEKYDEGTGDLVNFILAKDRLADVFKDDDYKIIDEFLGNDLIGQKYQALFPGDNTLKNAENGWQVVAADFVTTEDGTGVVHIAPAFGEDDMNLGQALNLPFIQHIAMDGIIKPGHGDLSGLSVKPIGDVQKTDVEIIKYLASRDLLFSKAQFEHSYPHCWRCETPLLNFATSSWFVKITAIKDEALKLAQEINWSPKHMKEGRFGKWLEGARDWSISRQRYWASVIPIWKCPDCHELTVIGSVKDLEDKSGQVVTDLHKDKIDPITIPCSKCQGVMHRVPDVLDTWFDSGSMPYAQKHYPFENKENFDQTFPAEFIAEGVDQTRAWFYYLHSISTAVYHSVAFKNVVANGIVLAEDGKKMSKRLQNYPDPTQMFDKYGADTMRFYLLTSPVMQAENINFSEKDMAVLSQGMFRMLWNTYSFFVMYAQMESWQPQEYKKSTNVLDEWIISELNILTRDVNLAMEKYELNKATRLFVDFIDNLSNWYLRRSRKRFKSENIDDKNFAFQTLHQVLIQTSVLLAPFTPFITESIFRNLTQSDVLSVHLTNYPESKIDLINTNLGQEMKNARALVEQGLALRAEAKIRTRQPLQSATIKQELRMELGEIVKDELNIKELLIDTKQQSEIKLETYLTDTLLEEGLYRDLVRKVQDLRKNAKLEPSQKIDLYYSANFPQYQVLEKFAGNLKQETNVSAITKATSDQDIWLGAAN